MERIRVRRRRGRVAGIAGVLALLLSTFVAVGTITAPAAAADPSPAPATTSQLITVNTPTSTSTTATITGWQRGVDGVWRVAVGPMSGWVGAAGIGRATEGGMRTPAGTYALTQAFGRQVDPGTRLPYFRTDPLDWWDENPASPNYNLHVRRAASPGAASENLYYSGSVYDYVVSMDYNMARVRNVGSAFFLHVSGGEPTAGCVSVSRSAMVSILKWLDPASHPYISIKVGAPWEPPTAPVGRLDLARATSVQGITVAGWAYDAAAGGSANVKVTVSGSARTTTTMTTAGIARPDVDRANAWSAPATGFRMVAGAGGPGPNTVCVSVVWATGTIPIGCRSVLVLNPFGRLDAVTVSGNTITAAGWALNPHNPGSAVAIQLRDTAAISQVLGNVRAAVSRPDVARVVPGYGPNHGYRIAFTARSKGAHTVCAVALPEFGGWSAVDLGCRSVVVR